MADSNQPKEASVGRTIEIVRHELTILCGRSRSRALGWPSDWRPNTVRDPRDRDGQVFTEVGAWEYIVELLESGHDIEQVELKNPKGKTGFVLLVDVGNDVPKIYIKLQIGSGTVLGRSFHYSEPDK
jgi:hypothetical protein